MSVPTIVFPQPPAGYALHQWPCAHVPFVGQRYGFTDVETGERGVGRAGRFDGPIATSDAAVGGGTVYTWSVASIITPVEAPHVQRTAGVSADLLPLNQPESGGV